MVVQLIFNFYISVFLTPYSSTLVVIFNLNAMRQVLIGIFLSIPILTLGQVETEVSITELMKEIQQWEKKDNKMSLAWWIPNEYWRIALKDNKQIPQETITQFENVFEGYLMIWACDLTINSDGTMNYTKEEEINKSITIVDSNNRKYFPLAKNQVGREALTIAENMKPFFSQALGQMGRGIHFYFFKVTDQNGRNLIEAKLPGEFKVLHSNSSFLWRLPLSALMPLKVCPVDNEKMKGTWSYCPIHGQKLEN